MSDQRGDIAKSYERFFEDLKRKECGQENSLVCPYCKAKDQEGEDLGDNPCFLTATCEECGGEFSYDSMREEYYNREGGNV